MAVSVSFLRPPAPVRASKTVLQATMEQVLAEPADDQRAAAEVDALLVLRSQLDAVLLGAPGRRGPILGVGTGRLGHPGSVAANPRQPRRHEAVRSITLARRLAEHPTSARHYGPGG